MLSALMLCWRNDNTVLQPAEMTSQHPICISKPRLNSSAIFVRTHVSARLCVCVLDTHTHKWCAWIWNAVLPFLRSLRGKLFLAPPQWRFIPDKLNHCFLENSKKKLNYSPINISETLIRFCVSVGMQGLDTICHLVSSLWRSCHSKPGFTLCLDTAHLNS